MTTATDEQHTIHIDWDYWRQQARTERALRVTPPHRFAIRYRGPEPGSQPLEVPWLSQIEPFGGPYGGSGLDNCGPDVLVMQGGWNGWLPTNRDMMHAIAQEVRGSQPWFINTPTGLQQLMDEVPRMSNNAASARWCSSVDDLLAALDAGQPPCILVQNRLLRPAEYDQTPGWVGTSNVPVLHWIALSGYDTSAPRDQCDLQVNDPLAWYVQGRVIYTGQSVRDAIDAAAQEVGGFLSYVIDAPDPRGVAPTPTPDQQPDDPCADVRTQLAAVSSDRDYNYNTKMAMEAALRGFEAKRRIKRGTTDAIIKSVPR